MKCLRTMVTLRILGVQGPFPRVIDPVDIPRLKRDRHYDATSRSTTRALPGAAAMQKRFAPSRRRFAATIGSWRSCSWIAGYWAAGLGERAGAGKNTLRLSRSSSVPIWISEGECVGEACNQVCPRRTESSSKTLAPQQAMPRTAKRKPLAQTVTDVSSDDGHRITTGRIPGAGLVLVVPP